MQETPDSYVTDLDEETSRFVSVLVSETPRGAILVSAQFADIMLQRLLTTACRSTQAASKLLDDFNAPLGTFSTRILAAYAFGLLPADEYWNLEQLRKVRNYCAHNMGFITFEDDKVRCHIENLRVEPNLENESPTVKLAFTLGTLQTWCSMLTPRLEQRSHERLFALEADQYAAQHDEELGKEK